MRRRATTRRRCRSPQAQEFIARLVPRVQAVEKRGAALARSAACSPSDIVSPIDVPSHDNSAMDGYALRGSELAPDARSRVAAVAGTGFAGGRFEGAVGARRVRAHHDRRVDAGRPRHRRAAGVRPRRRRPRRTSPAGVVRRGDNRRLAGEDLARGEVALRAGRVAAPGRSRPARLARPAPRCRCSAACASPSSRPATSCARSASRSTPGCGLRQQPLHAVGDAAAPRRRACSTSASCATIRRRSRPRSAAPPTPPTPSSPSAASASARPTTPSAVMAELGDVAVLADRDAARPADGDRPHRERRHAPPSLFGLPGNPVAVMVTFYAFVRDALLAMSGATAAPLPLLRAAASTPIRKKPGRTEYQRGIVTRAADGALAGAHHRRAGLGHPAQHERGQRAGRAAPRRRATSPPATWSTC